MPIRMTHLCKKKQVSFVLSKVEVKKQKDVGGSEEADKDINGGIGYFAVSKVW